MHDEYKTRLRAFVETHASKVELRDQGYGWGPEPSIYGWQDWAATEHISRVCSWVVPEGSVLTERTYSQFGDTLSGNYDEVGINVDGAHCSCGKYQDVTLRYRGSFEEVLMSILGNDGDRPRLVL